MVDFKESMNGQTSNWEIIRAGVPQGSILETLFLIMHNDLTTNLKSNVKLLADYTSLFSEVCNS